MPFSTKVRDTSAKSSGRLRLLILISWIGTAGSPLHGEAVSAAFPQSRPARMVQAEVVSSEVLRNAMPQQVGTMTLAPFMDLPLTLRVDRISAGRNGAMIMSGSVEGVHPSRFKLLHRAGVFAGSIHLPESREIRFLPDDAGMTHVQDLCRKRERACGSLSVEPPPTNRQRIIPSMPARPPVAADTKPRGIPVPSGCDDGFVIDLLIVYTTEARIAAGGVAAIQSLIDLAVDDTNTALANSLVSTSIYLVHTAEVAYVETGDSSLDGPALLAGTGALAAAHTLREQYAADLVGLWVDDLEVGGRVFAPTNPSGKSGFHEMRWDNWDLYTMAHEIGHNLGCAHDLPNSFNDAYFPWSYGYVDPLDEWHTIMAVFQPNPTIPHFSNPAVSYLGRPTGDDFADNAFTMELTRHLVANYRLAPVFGLPPVLRVDASAPSGGDGLTWATAFDDLQQALCQASRSRGDVQELWVAQGTYTPDLGSWLRQFSFRLQDGLAIYGGFAGTETLVTQRDPQANPTILSGDIGIPFDDLDNAMHVVVAEDVGATAILDGFTIQHGNADLESVFFFPRGGGMQVLSASPTILQCQFVENRASRNGAGVYCQSAAPTFANCEFTDNIADLDFYPGGGAMANFDGSAPDVLGCTFSGNFAGYVGGAIANYDSPASFTDCHFIENYSQYGGAVENGANSPASFISCGFHGNVADIHGGAFDIISSDPLIAGCVFTGNAAIANYGGCMTTFAASSPTIVNCTLVGNDGGSVGGAIANDSDGPTIANCILWDNVADFGNTEEQQIWNFAGQSYVDYTILHGWTGALGGSGNIGADPRLLDPAGQDQSLGTFDDDVRLRPGSPAIDSGDNAALPPEVLLDFAGSARRVDIPAIADTGAGSAPIVDRGAHEFTSGQCQSGDMNTDGLVTLADLPLFVNAVLTAPPGSCVGDMNLDGVHDALDMQTFVAVLLNP